MERKEKFEKKESNLIRLNKYLANAGVCSRRDADTYISDGFVKVNGKVVTELGVKVKISDDVTFKGRKLKPEGHVYILLNKTKGVVTTLDDPQGRTTVLDVIKNACTERVYPVGRLDMNTTGLLLLTNDGDLASKLSHPSYKKKKIYHVATDRPVSKGDLQLIINGVELEDGVIVPDGVAYLDDTKLEVGIEIHSGKNRVVRRLFEHFGYKVKKLDRVYFAGLTKKNLPRGKYRFLTDAELNMLKSGKYR